MKKFAICFMALLCVSMTTAFAKYGILNCGGATMFGDYGSARGWDSTCSVSGGNACETLYTKYTLGNTAGQGTAYLYDRNGNVLDFESTKYVEYPAEAIYTTTSIDKITYHSHEFIDGRKK